MSVDSILERLPRECPRGATRQFGHFAFDGDRPRRRFEASRVVGWRVFVCSVLIVGVVICSQVFGFSVVLKPLALTFVSFAP
jgi:hypothetical protein